MHLFFRDVRVHKRKEFFAASTDDVHRFFDLMEDGNQGEGDEMSALWAYALAKARA